MSVLIVGLLLGGTYAMMAMGLQLQYGVARVMNLANGEMIQREIGLTKRFKQQLTIERTRRITALARRLHPY